MFSYAVFVTSLFSICASITIDTAGFHTYSSFSFSRFFFLSKRIHAVLQGVFFHYCLLFHSDLFSMLYKRVHTSYIVYDAQNNCLKCSLSESWMICVIICVFNTLQLCSLHIFGVLIPDHCRFEHRINGKNQWKMNVTMIKRECTGKGCEGEKPKSKEKIITNHISYIRVNIRIANAPIFKPKRSNNKQFIIIYINLNLNLGL